MRWNTVLRTLLCLKDSRILKCSFDEKGMICDVAISARRKPRCGRCGEKSSGYDRHVRTWRHLDLAGMICTLRATIRRVDCKDCGVVVEEVPWASHAAKVTYAFEDLTGYLAQRCDRTTISKLLRVSWVTVGNIIDRLVARKQKQRGDRLNGLRYIGVDELSYRRHHKYVTVVVDHERGEVVWVAEGKSAATLGRFFKELGPERCAALEAVTIDMSGAYIRAVSDASPEAQIIFDRFHVQRLAHEALDEVRREEVRGSSASQKSSLKGLRWVLHKSDWNLTHLEREKLENLPKTNEPIFRAHMLKESLVAILDRRQIHVAEAKLNEWIRWAWYCGLKPFEKLSRTILKHKEGILAYVRTRLNNGRTEGFNGKARTITRRSYGFHSVQNLIAMLFLCCGGITLIPPHIRPNLPT